MSRGKQRKTNLNTPNDVPVALTLLAGLVIVLTFTLILGALVLGNQIVWNEIFN